MEDKEFRPTDKICPRCGKANRYDVTRCIFCKSSFTRQILGVRIPWIEEEQVDGTTD